MRLYEAENVAILHTKWAVSGSLLLNSVPISHRPHCRLPIRQSTVNPEDADVATSSSTMSERALAMSGRWGLYGQRLFVLLRRRH